MRGGTRNRWCHHVVLVAISLLATGLIAQFGSAGTLLDGLSLATAYLCLVFMGVALSLGPLRVIRADRLALNIYLRRDIGIWAALTGLVHLFVATELSMNQSYMTAYVNLSSSGLSAGLRGDLFSWGSIAGFVVGIFVLLLLFLSNDKALRVMGPTWWKRLQRIAYPAFFLTLLHGFAFQALEARNVLLVGIVIGVFLGVLALQIYGLRIVTKGAGR